MSNAFHEKICSFMFALLSIVLGVFLQEHTLYVAAPYEVLKCAYLKRLPQNIHLWKKQTNQKKEGRRKRKTTLCGAANNQCICPRVNCKQERLLESKIFSFEHPCTSHKARCAFDWEWMWKVPISFPCMSIVNMCAAAPWALMAETWAIKATTQSNQLCVIRLWLWLCQACVPHCWLAERDSQSHVPPPHMFKPPD